jgi:hypothetical protein
MMLLHRAREGRIFSSAIGVFLLHCNISQRILGLGASGSRPAPRYGTRTRAGLIRSIFRQSRSAKANLARHGWIGATSQGLIELFNLFLSPSSRRLS